MRFYRPVQARRWRLSREIRFFPRLRRNQTLKHRYNEPATGSRNGSGKTGKGNQMTQDDYMDLLFNELGFDTKTLKMGFINKRISRFPPKEINYYDEMKPWDKSRIIDELKDIQHKKYGGNKG